VNKLIISIAAIIVGFALCVPAITAKDTKAEGRIGELLIIATGVQETKTNAGRQSEPGFHYVRFTIVARNIGKHALCTFLKSRLEGTFNVESRGFIYLKDKTGRSALPENWISQLLPGGELEGDILFVGIRDGVEPLRLHIEQPKENQGCGKEPVHAYPLGFIVKVANIPKVESISELAQP
jgi:hypothetical protein